MQAFTTLTVLACPLGLANVDTDQLIPAKFMKRPRANGYGGFLLHDLRFDGDGHEKPQFALNHPGFAGASILVARRNFGTGSSREAAVYALWDHGIRCVIAPSFGDIFASNAVKNGLLPAVISEADIEALLGYLSGDAARKLSVDLEHQTISLPDSSDGTSREVIFAFAVDPVQRMQLLNGWDDIDLTMRHENAISTYRAHRRRNEPWAWPQG